MTVAIYNLEGLGRRLAGLESGLLRVVGVAVEPRFDRDRDEYVQVTLHLAEVPAGTVALDDAYELRARVRATAAEFGIGAADLAITTTFLGDSGTADDSDEDVYDLRRALGDSAEPDS